MPTLFMNQRKTNGSPLYLASRKFRYKQYILNGSFSLKQLDYLWNEMKENPFN